MGRTRRGCYALLMILLLTPRAGSAIELRWSDGSLARTFTEATRCTLEVRADSTEERLPAEWRLLWQADSSGIGLVAVDSITACAGSVALMSMLEPSPTTADSIAGLTTARFCSAGEERGSVARYVLDQPGGSAGRLMVVALDPDDPDSSQVIVSNEVTYNGGVSGAYPPVVLRAGRTHPTSDLRIEAVGYGLLDAPRVEIVAPDTSWRLALDIETRSGTRLTATARVAADLEEFALSVGRSSGETGVATLAADTASALSVQPACTNEMKEINFLSHEDIQPRDFSIIASRDSFHVFYTRQDYLLPFTQDTKVVGHKRSRDLYNWDPDEHTMHAIEARPGRWDGAHVWAPSIIKKPGDITYHMIYTGVDANGVQRIGVATSTDLNVWSQDSTAIYASNDVGWAQFGTPEFRDPFVMVDPDSAGRYLLYFVTKTQERGRMVVGVARTNRDEPGNLRLWQDPQPLWSTDSLVTNERVIESPHAFKDPGNRWWLFFTGYNSLSDPAYVSFLTNDVSPADTTTANWSTPDTLFAYLGGDQKVQFWHGSEHYRLAPGYEYLMAYNDSEHSVDISQVSWRDPHAFVLTDSCPPRSPLDVEGAPGVGRIAFEIIGPHPTRAPVGFRLHVPTRMHVDLALFDIAGRRVRTLLDGEIPAGVGEVRWDGGGRKGRRHVQGSTSYGCRLGMEYGTPSSCC